MANVAFHMAAGLVVGGALTVPRVVRAWTAQAPLARPIGTMLMAATMCGFLAIIPNVLRWFDVASSVYTGWWANVFVLHPVIDGMRSGGMLIGHVAIALFFIGSYLLLLFAILSRRRRATRVDTPS